MKETIEKELTIFDFIPKVLPFLDVAFIILIAFLSPDPWITTPIHAALPFFAVMAIKANDKGLIGFYLTGVIACIPVFVLNFWGSPDCPTWLNQYTFIAGGLLLTKTVFDRFVILAYALLVTIPPLYINGNTWLFIIIVVISEITVWFLLERSVAFMSMQRMQVEKQKRIIEEKNKDITDSINYAKRIQQAKLPNVNDVYAALPQSFVLFKPKDIVSGDFYYFHKKEKRIFIAAADCTGHGVPGAFMSMIGSEKLNDAILNSDDVAQILSLLNKGIKISLRQTNSDESTRDGMDIALCTINVENRIVVYAGANRPLWIIRKGQTEVEEIKATKKAIGGLTEEHQLFDPHELKLNSGDTFYLSTDGYADTFSGESGKKLTTKKFKELLISIQDKTMHEQFNHLDEFIENWKKGAEQIDDILVIGVRL